MREVLAHIVGDAPYSQSRKHDLPAPTGVKANSDEHDMLFWREKANYNLETGEIYIPAMALKQALDSVAQRLNEKIPGKGHSTFTKVFRTSVLSADDVPLGVSKDDVAMIAISANSNGVRGSGSRVTRRFPIIPKWSGVARYVVFDDELSAEVVERYIRASGLYIGVGRFRPDNGGTNGRFHVEKFEWSVIG